MRKLAWVLVGVIGCSESKQQEAPAAAPAPATAPKKDSPPPTPTPTPAPPPAANRNAENIAALTITGAWDVKLEGGGAYCRFNNDAKEREVDRGARIKVDTRKLGIEGRWASFAIHTDSTGKVTMLQVDVATDELAPSGGGAKKQLTYGMNSPGAKVTKAEVAPDGSSATVDATLGSTKKDGKTVHVAGTVTCKHIGTFAF